MDLMNQIGLVIVTSLSTFILVSDLEKLFKQNGKNLEDMNGTDWRNDKRIRCLEEGKSLSLIELPEMNPKIFDKEASQWSFQPADYIKTIIGESFDLNSIDGCQSIQSKIVEKEMRCFTTSIHYFKPNEIKLVQLRIPSAQGVALLTNDERHEKKGWLIQDIVLPSETKDIYAYIKNDSLMARTLSSNSSVSSLEVIDEDNCIDIETTEEEQQSVKSISNINKQIWDEINAFPPASEQLLKVHERHLEENDNISNR